MPGINGAGGVKITVRFLGGGKLGDERVKVSRHFGVGMNRQRIGSAFQNLVKVGVVERKSRRFAVLNVLTAQHGGGALKIVHAPGRLALSKGMGDGDGAVGFEAGRPEGVVQVDGGERHGLDGVIARRGAGRQRIQTENDGQGGGGKGTAEKCGFHADTCI
jgi:hypothetical protein